MSKQARRARERAQVAEKRQNRRVQKDRAALDFARRTKGMKRFVLQLSCGCCDEIGFFHSEDTLVAQMNENAFRSSAVIVDDLGRRIEGVDTFYGFRLEDEERRGIDFLLTQLHDSYRT